MSRARGTAKHSEGEGCERVRVEVVRYGGEERQEDEIGEEKPARAAATILKVSAKNGSGGVGFPASSSGRSLR